MKQIKIYQDIEIFGKSFIGKIEHNNEVEKLLSEVMNITQPGEYKVYPDRLVVFKAELTARFETVFSDMSDKYPLSLIDSLLLASNDVDKLIKDTSDDFSNKIYVQFIEN